MVSWLSERRLRAGVLFAIGAWTAGGFANLASAQSACPDVEVLFARGSGELPGLGIVGGPLVDAITSGLPGKDVSAYAVDYLADIAQTSAGSGADDMTNHLVETADRCPDTQFIVGGYSQGASVVDIALGIPTILGIGESIPSKFLDRIKAVVVFGNPLALTAGSINDDPTWNSRTREFCNLGDPVCAAGVNVLAHITYGFDGSADDAGSFAAQQVQEKPGAP